MKILYLADQDLDNESGVSQKISMQSTQWVKEGHDVIILSLESLSFFSVDKQRMSTAKINIKRAGWKIFLHLLVSTWKLKVVLKEVQFDLIYMRYRLYVPFFKRALKKEPLVVEINSDDVNEYKHSSVLLYTYNKVFRKLFLRTVDGFVSVSRELSEGVKIFKKPRCVIANGISTSEIFVHKRTESTRPSLVFIGSPNQKWHGVDKIASMARILTEFDFHVIGFEGSNTKNLFYYGVLANEEANAFVARQDLGISTLSLYEKTMHEASPLKARQYLAYGLPMIYAYEDTDFKDAQAFTLKLKNTENNVVDSIEEVRSFVNKVYKDDKLREKSRLFAEQSLNVVVKEKKRLSFFGSLL